MINDLIKRCQEEVGIKSCKDCGLCEQDNFNDLECLEYLIEIYNKKYDEDYCIVHWSGRF